MWIAVDPVPAAAVDLDLLESRAGWQALTDRDRADGVDVRLELGQQETDARGAGLGQVWPRVIDQRDLASGRRAQQIGFVRCAERVRHQHLKRDATAGLIEGQPLAKTQPDARRRRWWGGARERRGRGGHRRDNCAGSTRRRPDRRRG